METKVYRRGNDAVRTIPKPKRKQKLYRALPTHSTVQAQQLQCTAPYAAERKTSKQTNKQTRARREDDQQ